MTRERGTVLEALRIDSRVAILTYGCQAAAVHLIAQRSGKIINLASVLSQVGLPGYTARGRPCS